MTKKQKYIKFLNENESFQNWIKSSPFQIIGFSIKVFEFSYTKIHGRMMKQKFLLVDFTQNHTEFYKR